MALFYPSMEQIKNMKVKPTDGENFLLHTLQEELDDSYEVFFQPFLNGDEPDIIIVRKKYGVVIIEVKDWNLDYYEVGNDGLWSLKNYKGRVLSPIKQVKNYKDSMYDWHIEGLLEKKILNNNYYGIIKCAVYFHNELKRNVMRFLNNEHDRYVTILARDTINQVRYLLNRRSDLFTDEIYEKIRHCLMPSFHKLESGIEPHYNDKQKELIQLLPGIRKIKGVAGSGKTLVLARRAVNAHKRTKAPVLILTFNITLRNYIRDCISKVREDLEWSNFQIMHYHLFINKQCDKYGISYSPKMYENINIFEEVKGKIKRFSAIFIDEIQDFKYEWQQIIRKYFLSEGGELVLFGDEKQNIYNRTLEKDKKIKTIVPGAWNQLNISYRLPPRISELAIEYQKYFFNKRYELDKIEVGEQQELDLQYDEQLHYYFFENVLGNVEMNKQFAKLYEMIERMGIHRNDICILAPSIELLRNLDFYMRHTRRENTTRTFEKKEVYEEIRNKRDNRRELEKLRRERKYNFWMNSGTTKLSTIHSFKGWEINNLILIIEPEQTIFDGQEMIAIEELIYTGMTRCRQNLFIINMANQVMHSFFMKQQRKFDKVE